MNHCKETDIVYSSYTPRDLYYIMCNAEQSGAFVAHVRGDLCQTAEDFFREISSAMRFPYYFGWNWDAFDECINDLEWLKFSYLLIIIDHYESIFMGDISSKRLLVKCLMTAKNEWSSRGIPLTVMLNSQDEKQN